MPLTNQDDPTSALSCSVGCLRLFQASGNQDELLPWLDRSSMSSLSSGAAMMRPCDGAPISFLPASRLLAETLETPSDNKHKYQQRS